MRVIEMSPAILFTVMCLQRLKKEIFRGVFGTLSTNYDSAFLQTYLCHLTIRYFWEKIHHICKSLVRL